MNANGSRLTFYGSGLRCVMEKRGKCWKLRKNYPCEMNESGCEGCRFHVSLLADSSQYIKCHSQFGRWSLRWTSGGGCQAVWKREGWNNGENSANSNYGNGNFFHSRTKKMLTTLNVSHLDTCEFYDGHIWPKIFPARWKAFLGLPLTLRDVSLRAIGSLRMCEAVREVKFKSKVIKIYHEIHENILQMKNKM